MISGWEGFAYRIFVPWIGFGAILFLPNLTCFPTLSSRSTEGRRFSGFAGTGRAVEFPDPAAAVVSLLRRVYAQGVCGVRGWECCLLQGAEGSGDGGVTVRCGFYKRDSGGYIGVAVVDLGMLVRAGSAMSLLIIGVPAAPGVDCCCGTAKQGGVVYSGSEGKSSGRCLAHDGIVMNLLGRSFSYHS